MRTVGPVRQAVNPAIAACTSALVNVRKSNRPGRGRCAHGGDSDDKFAGTMPPFAERVSAGVAAVTLATAVVVLVARPTARPDDVAPPEASPVPQTPALVDPDTIGAATTSRPTVVRSAPAGDAPEASRLREGITLPVIAREGSFFGVLTPCEVTGWVDEADVELHPRATGTPSSLAETTIVIDPGHGGVLSGAVGPAGLPEKEPNLDIARRLAEHIRAARVFLTHDDFTAGLAYRAELAERLGAHAFVSIHNNAAPDGPSERPGTETFYQFSSSPSKRLAGLLYEDLVGALDGFDVSWVADTDAGAKYRRNDSGLDYYALIREAAVPTVIVEGLYLSNPPEEDLLRRPDVRERMASALARGLDRFVTTSDAGSGFTEPYPRDPGPSGRLPAGCVDPV